MSWRAYNYTVFPGKNSKLIEAGDKVPTGGNITRYEDADGENREWVH